MRNKSIYLILLLVLVFQNCSTKQNNLSQKSFSHIKEKKIENLRDKIVIAEKLNKYNSFQVFINDDNKISYICPKGQIACNYYNKNKHSYSINSSVEEDIIWLRKNSFSPDFDSNSEEIQCGRGSFSGFFLVFDNINMTNYNKKNPKLCFNRFTKLDSMQLGYRILSGFFTLGTSLFTTLDMHSVKFDKGEFEESILESNLNDLQKILFAKNKYINLNSGFDIIYLDASDMEDSLKDKYNEIKYSKSKKDALIFFDEKTNTVLSTLVLNEYKDNNLIKNISFQINQIIKDTQKSSKKSLISQKDMLIYIPKKINKPNIPAVPKLVKSEYEKKKSFEKRVLTAVKNREKIIYNLQTKYNLDVYERNEYIKNLELAFNEYKNNISNNNIELINELENNISLLSKILFIENISGFDANNFKYDAEEEKLYFSIFSKKEFFKQDVFATMPVDIAKNIKENKTFSIEAILEFKNNYLGLKGFKITEKTQDESFDVFYTNINFIPISESVRVVTKKENIKTSKDKIFSKFKQDKSLITNKEEKEIWYIELVSNINSNVPKWFTNPDLNKTVAYGQSSSLQEAKNKALVDLAYMKKVQITSSLEIKKTKNTSFKSFKEVQKTIKTSTDVQLNSGDYLIYKQENIDGIWYVALIYKNK